jgi:hypothetical protein
VHREIKKNLITANVGLRTAQAEWMGHTQGNIRLVVSSKNLSPPHAVFRWQVESGGKSSIEP